MPRILLTAFVIAGLLFVPSCSNTGAKAAIAEQKKSACDTWRLRDKGKELMSIKAQESFNKLANLDPTYTELAKQAIELNLIANLVKAGVKNPDLVAKSASLYATFVQFCNSTK